MTDAVTTSSGPQESKLRQLADIFDNEALWDAEDTDEYILNLVMALEPVVGIAVNEMCDQGHNSLLHMAAMWNRPKVMEEMIRRGSDLNAKNVNGHTPLDIAMHHGNIDLAQQLRHYGGKHTCESERDIAIAQRDLAQHQIQDCETELVVALQTLKRAKQDREELRVERDRLAQLNAGLVANRDELAEQKRLLEIAVTTLSAEKQQLQLQVAQHKEQLACEQSVRQNAVQSWQVAQQVIAELQGRELGCREREEEALRLRNEALHDRDVARDVARLAQLDQGLAKQSQLEAERARDGAVERLLIAEASIAKEKESCAKKIAKTELDRRNIQIEIDRQTEKLRNECDRLEKQLMAANATTWKHQEQLAEARSRIESLECSVVHREYELTKRQNVITKLEQQVETILDERADEHKQWRTRIERKLRDLIVDDLRRMLSAVIGSWERLQWSQDQLRGLDVHNELVPELSESLLSETSVRSPLSSPQTRPATTPTNLRPMLLPALSVPKSMDNAASTMSPEPSARGFPCEDSPDGHVSIRPIDPKDRVASARSCLTHLDGDHNSSTAVADEVTALSTATQLFLERSMLHLTKALRDLRRQVQALEKMVERKDELIARFNHHRQEKLKQAQPARLRECAYKLA